MEISSKSISSNEMIGQLEEIADRVKELFKFTSSTRNVHVKVKDDVAHIQNLMSGFLRDIVEGKQDGNNPVQDAVAEAEKSFSNVCTQTALSKRASKGKQMSSRPREDLSKGVNQERDCETLNTSGAGDWMVVSGRRQKQSGKKRAAADVGDRVNIKPPTAPRSRKRIPLEVIKVSCVGEMDNSSGSYADVLRAVHSQSSSLNADVKKIRRNGKGELLLHLGRSCNGAEALQLALTKAAGNGMLVRREVPSLRIVIRDLDEGIFKADVESALQNVLGETEERIRVFDLRPSRYGSQSCLANVPYGEKTVALLREGRIKIGLVRCHVREWVTIRQCFRCFGFGHFAAKCSGPDRTSLCRKCGHGGHFLLLAAVHLDVYCVPRITAISLDQAAVLPFWKRDAMNQPSHGKVSTGGSRLCDH